MIPDSIEHSNPLNKKVTLINWCLGNTCNYRCSYCPDSLHSGSVKWVDYQACVNFCQKLIKHYNDLGQTLEFLFTGGEPTLYPHFISLVKELKEKNSRIGLISNGSRTLRYWRDIAPLLDNVVLTHHIEFVELGHFIEVINLLSVHTTVHINVTMLPSKFDACLDNAIHISNCCSNISISLKPLLINFGASMYDYSSSQLNTLNTWKFNDTKKDAKISRGMMKQQYEDRTSKEYNAIDFILKDENHWQGWNCSVGIELVYIDYNGTIYRGTCHQGGVMGQINNPEEVMLPMAPVLCKKPTCHCLSDIMTTKKKQLNVK